MQMTQSQILELDKLLHKLKLSLIKNNEIKVIISKRGSSIILDKQILEDCLLDKS
jgi:hypothetical protein